MAQSLKSMILPKLCWIMNDMSEFLLMEIDDYSIIMGWLWLKVVERAGFMVDFALDHVKSIAAVAFFIRDNKCSIEDIPFYELHKEIEEHSKEIERRKVKIENLSEHRTHYLETVLKNRDPKQKALIKPWN